MGGGEEGTLDSILLLPWSWGEPDYRDAYREAPKSREGGELFFGALSTFTGSPELIAPGKFHIASQTMNGTEQIWSSRAKLVFFPRKQPN